MVPRQKRPFFWLDASGGKLTMLLLPSPPNARNRSPRLTSHRVFTLNSPLAITPHSRPRQSTG